MALLEACCLKLTRTSRVLCIPSATELSHLRVLMRLSWTLAVTSTIVSVQESHYSWLGCLLREECNKFKCVYLSQSLNNPQQCGWLGVLRPVCSGSLKVHGYGCLSLAGMDVGVHSKTCCEEALKS